jgi:hypothetical protein
MSDRSPQTSEGQQSTAEKVEAGVSNITKAIRIGGLGVVAYGIVTKTLTVESMLLAAFMMAGAQSFDSILSAMLGRR